MSTTVTTVEEAHAPFSEVTNSHRKRTRRRFARRVDGRRWHGKQLVSRGRPRDVLPQLTLVFLPLRSCYHADRRYVRVALEKILQAERLSLEGWSDASSGPLLPYIQVSDNSCFGVVL